jgi:hypothetical protein
MIACTATPISTLHHTPPGQQKRGSVMAILEDGETRLLVYLEALTNYCISLYREAKIQQLAVRMDDP